MTRHDMKAIRFPEKALDYGSRPLSQSWAVLLALVSGLALAGYGIWTFDLAVPGAWPPETLRAVSAFSSLCLALGLAAYFAGPRHRAVVLTALLVLWIAVAAGLGATVALLLLGVSAAATGDMAFGRSREHRFGSWLSVLTCMSLGLGIYAALVGYASHFAINGAALYIPLLTLPIGISWRRVAWYFGKFRSWLELGGPTLNTADFVLYFLLLLTLSMQCVYAALPEVYHDALALHLLVATKMASAGIWQSDPAHLIGSVTPQGANWLFSIGAILAGERGAKLVNYGLLCLITAFVGALGSRAYGRTIGLLFAGLFASTPLSFLVTASLFSENALALYVTAAFAILITSWKDLHTKEAVGLGLLLGAAAHIKLQSVLLIAPLGCFLLYAILGRTSVSEKLQMVVLAMLAALFAGAMPYAYAYATTGNPVFPFFNAIFKSPMFDTATNFSDPTWVGKLSWRLPYDWTFESGRFIEGGNGVIGFAILSLLPAAFVASLVTRDKLFFWAVFVALTFVAALTAQTQYLRYAYYVLPLLTLAGASGVNYVARLKPSLHLSVLVLGILLVLMSLACLPSAGWPFRTFDVSVVVDRTREPAWLDGKVPQRRLNNIINAVAGESAKVLIVAPPVGAGLRGTPYYVSWYNPLMLAQLSALSSDRDVRSFLSKTGITHIIITPENIPPYISDKHPLVTYTTRSAKFVTRNGPALLFQVDISAEEKEELLSDGNFSQGIGKWNPQGSVEMPQGSKPIMRPRSALSQAVGALPSDSILLSAKVLCGMRPSDVQLQVNFLDEHGGIIGTDIAPQGCPRPGFNVLTHRFSAPDRTKSAFLYINMVGGEPVIVEEISAKRL